MTENLIIDGVDHAKFDLEWAKRGGLFVVKPKYMEINDETMRDYEFFYTFCAGKVICIIASLYRRQIAHPKMDGQRRRREKEIKK